MHITAGRPLLSFLLVGSSLCMLGSTASAQDVACQDLENPVYVQMGSTVLPLLRNLARELRDSEANPMTVVFTDGRSCSMIDSMINGTKLTTNMSYVPSRAEDPNWTPDMPPKSCTIPAEGVDLSMVHSDVFVESCTNTPVPDNIAVFTGPVLPFVFVVPKASSQTAITAEEAFFAWGFGESGGAAPWIEEAFLFTRPNTSGTKITFGANIGVPASKWKGEQLAKTSDVLNAVANSVNPEPTLGIAGGSSYDNNRDALKALAFKSFGQTHAYFPDSTSTSFDKQNVRDGHYTLWAPAVFITPVDADKNPTDTRAKYLLDLLLSRETEPAADFDSTQIIIDQGLIPDCAMQVARTGQGGDLALYTPARSCSCFFENRTGGGDDCVTCTDDTECTNGTCNFGYCEDTE